MTKQTIHCLIVEDDSCMADFLAQAISHPDIHIFQATNGEQALETLASGTSVDIIITDLNMPEMGGEGLIARVRKISPRTLIIVITGYASIPSAVSMMKQGVFDYLTKPVELDNFLNAVTRAVKQVKQFREKKTVNDISELWHIGRLMDKNLTPDHLLNSVVNTAVKITKGKGGALFLHLDNNLWHESVRNNFDAVEALCVLEGIKRNLGRWTGTNQEDINGSALQILENEKLGKVLAAPFVDEGVVVAILVLALNRKEIDMNLPGLLAVFCSQISPIVNMSISIIQLLHSHEESIKANSALEKLHEELKQSTKLACIGELAAGIAHDINTPLTCIIGFIRLYLRFLDKPGVRIEELLAVRHYIDRAGQEAERCQEIINHFLLFSRKESKSYQPFVLIEVIDRTYNLLEKQLNKGQIFFSREVPPTLPLVMGNANQIQQVLMNLVVNAKNAMPQGGKIHIKAEAIDAGKIKVTVSDNGKGIPPQNLSKIFEPFYTTDTQGKGTGLGLSISKKIIQEHGGEIYAESEVNKGSSFILLLPLAT